MRRPGREFMDQARWWFVPLLLLLLASLQSLAAPEKHKRPNILLITIESLRSDHVSCYGYERQTTPALDDLAATGIRFENAYSVTSWTLPSHASIFTGLYPSVHGAIRYDDKLGESFDTLAEILASRGYQTAGIVSGPLLKMSRNLDQGFSYYDDTASEERNTAAHGDITNPRMEDLINDFLVNDREQDRPFFLFAYLWDPHYDYIPPEPYDNVFVPLNARPIDISMYEQRTLDFVKDRPGEMAYLLSQYDGEILWTDALLGRLWSRLRVLDLWDDTAIIVTSDHGEAFFEHGVKGHKKDLHEEEIAVPLVVKRPGQREPEKDDRLVNSVDLFPTVLDLAGVEIPTDVHGESLLARSSRSEIYFELQSPKRGTPPMHAIRSGSQKVILKGGAAYEAYDLDRDPGELDAMKGARVPLFHSEDGRSRQVAALVRKLEGHMKRMEEDAAARRQQEQPPELSPEELERLRSLGYVDDDGN